MARISFMSLFTSFTITHSAAASALNGELLGVNLHIHRAAHVLQAERAIANILKRQGVVTPDGTCGGTNGYTCTGSQGGVQPCCSASGFCGAGPSYCDAGCQPSFGTCGSPSTPAAPSHQTILVGADGLTFSPDTITASPGSRISFQFSPGHHSVTQSSFADPCHPLSSSSMYSGFVDDTTMIWTIPVADTNPIYLYCSAPFHCQLGMVMVINPPSSGATLAAYRNAAGGSSASSNPSQVQGGTFSAFSISPDGSCGGANSYTCTGSQGGIQPCCSASGFCGAGPAYCGSGCQSLFGTCDPPPASSSSSLALQDSSSSPTSSLSPVPTTSSLLTPLTSSTTVVTSSSPMTPVILPSSSPTSSSGWPTFLSSISLGSLPTTSSSSAISATSLSTSSLMTSNMVSLYTSSSSTSLMNSSSRAYVSPPPPSPRQTVAVGLNGNKFTPETVIAQPGDKVVFQFYPGFHSVVESSQTDPCHPLGANSTNSGVVRNQGVGPSPNVFIITVNNTNSLPTYLYCSVGSHCQSGMVMIINPDLSNRLDNYKSNAAGAGASTAPPTIEGGVWEDTESLSSLSSSSSSSVVPSPSATGGITPDGTCGGVNGYTCTGSQGGIQPCCSSSGFCGNGPLYCGVGCQSAFGSCFLPSLSSLSSSSPSGRASIPSSSFVSSTSFPTSIASGRPVTPDGSCGSGSLGGFTCTGIQGVYLPCCSFYGYCGEGPLYCGDGCQGQYGICSSGVSSVSSVLPGSLQTLSSNAAQNTVRSSLAVASPTPSNLISPDGTCGPAIGYNCFNSYFGNCCSEFGFCGDLGEYCGAGCQPQYGTCNYVPSISSIIGTLISNTQTRLASTDSISLPTSTWVSSKPLGGSPSAKFSTSTRSISVVNEVPTSACQPKLRRKVVGVLRS